MCADAQTSQASLQRLPARPVCDRRDRRRVGLPSVCGYFPSGSLQFRCCGAGVTQLVLDCSAKASRPVRRWFAIGSRLVQGWDRAGSRTVLGWFLVGSRLVRGWFPAAFLLTDSRFAFALRASPSPTPKEKAMTFATYVGVARGEPPPRTSTRQAVNPLRTHED